MFHGYETADMSNRRTVDSTWPSESIGRAAKLLKNKLRKRPKISLFRKVRMDKIVKSVIKTG